MVARRHALDRIDLELAVRLRPNTGLFSRRLQRCVGLSDSGPNKSAMEMQITLCTGGLGILCGSVTMQRPRSSPGPTQKT